MASYNNGYSTIYDIKHWNTQVQPITASRGIVKYLFKWQTFQGLKLAQLDKMLYVIYSTTFQTKIHGWAYDNWKSY